MLVNGALVEPRGPVHAIPAHRKILVLLVFVAAVVITPREVLWAFAVHGVIVTTVIVAAHIPVGHVVRRLTIEVPFVLFAVLLPFVGPSPTVDVLGLALSHQGLWAAWGIIARSTLCLAAAILVASTTSVAELVAGFERLRVPRSITGIIAFMSRYGDVLAGDLQRMRVARMSRGDRSRWWWQAGGVAATAGTLFVRAFERGERVHLAMRARGYAGAMPTFRSTATNDTRFVVLPAIAAMAVAMTALALR